MKEKPHYIILLKYSKDEREDYLYEKVLSLLNERSIFYEQQYIDGSSFLKNSLWKIDKMIKVDLTVLGK